MRALHCSSTKRNKKKRRTITAIYYWYNTRSSGRIICRLAATLAAAWPARIQHMAAQQHTRNQPLRGLQRGTMNNERPRRLD